MHPSGLSPAVLTCVCAVCLGAAIAAPASPESGPTTAPVVRPENALSAADVEQLRQAIKGLHQRFEDQGPILEGIQARLDAISARLEHSPASADLDALRQSVGTLVTRVAETRAAVAQLTDALGRTGSGPGNPAPATSADVTRLHDELTVLADDLARWRKELAARPPVSAGADLSSVVVVAAIGTLLVAGLVLYFGMKPRGAPQTEAVLAVASLGQQIGQLREQLAAQAARSPPPAESPLLDAIARLQDRLARLEKPAPAGEPAAALPPEARASVAPVPAPAPGAAAMPAALWPEPFRTPASSLARWRIALETDLSSPDRPALPVVAALLALRVVAERPGAGAVEIAQAVNALSEALHAYWQTLPNLTEDDLVQASGEWIDAIRPLLSRAAPRLAIEQVMPGSRFNSDTMQTVQQGSGNHLNVAAVYSWVVRDLSGERPRVLHRARAATT